MYQEGIDKKRQELISVYQIIYKTVFKYGIFVILILWALYITQNILQTQTNIITITDTTAETKDLTIKSFKKSIDMIKSSGDLNIYVWLGWLQQSWNFLFSYNNLASYRGYILPRYFSGDVSIFWTNGLFDWTWYSKKELETFIVNFLNSKSMRKDINTQASPIEITTDILTTFNLQCLSQQKIYNGLCDIFTQNFVKTFLLYDITQDIVWFKDVFSTIMASNREKYQDELCKNMIYYSYYSKNASNDIKEIMKSCHIQEYDTFNKYALFSKIQKELETKTINTTVYGDVVVDSYKINSFLQILYEDINNDTIKMDRVRKYLDFIEELLKEENINSLEANIIYYFNNYKLKGLLEKPEFLINISNKKDINAIIKKINTINNGNLLVGYKGLKYMINDNITIKQDVIDVWEQNNTASGTQEAYTANIDKLLWQINNFSIEDRQISGNQILAKWILKITAWDTNEISLPTKTWFQEQSSVLFLKKITISGENEITTSINTILTKEQRSFWDLQKYLLNNSNVLNTKPDIKDWGGTEVKDKTFCDKAVWNGEKGFSGAIVVEECSDTNLITSFQRSGRKININITYENFVFKGIDVSDPEAKVLAMIYLKKPETISKYATIDQNSLIPFTQDLIDSFIIKKAKPTEFSASENTIIVLETVKKYLWANVTDIVEKGDKVSMIFSLWWVDFIANYNIKTHSIEQLYFKNIMTNWIPILIKNVEFVLDDSNLTELKKFRKDPITYFKDKSPENYLLYMKNIQ